VVILCFHADATHQSQLTIVKTVRLGRVSARSKTLKHVLVKPSTLRLPLATICLVPSFVNDAEMKHEQNLVIVRTELPFAILPDYQSTYKWV
jgi:hypothetical protein